MVYINPTLSIITLNVCGLNTLIKRQELSEWIKSKAQLYAVYKKPTLGMKTTNIKSEGIQKYILCQY